MDLRTLIFISTLISLTASFITLIMFFIEERIHGTELWTIGQFLFGISYLLLVMRGIIPDFFSIIVSNFISIFSITILYHSLKLVKKDKKIPYTAYLISFIFSCGFAFAYFTNGSLNMRIFITSLHSSIIFLMSFVFLLKNIKKEDRFTLGLIMISFASLGMFFMLRTVYSINSKIGHDFFAPDVINSILFIVIPITTVLSTFGYITNLNRHLENELFNEKESELKYIEELKDKNSILVSELELVKYYAEYDQLTGVYNRNKGIQILEKEYDNAVFNKASLIICYLDVDNLKKTNDTYGHKTGDELLKNSIRIILENIPEGSLISRIGGDEFIIAFKNENNENAESILKNINNKLLEFKNNNKLRYPMSISYGYACIDFERNLSLNELIKLADTEMYKNKKSGKIKESDINDI